MPRKSSSGRATSILAEHIGRRTDGIAALLKDMETDGQILRNVGTKRTYEIMVGDVPQHLLERARELLAVARKPVALTA